MASAALASMLPMRAWANGLRTMPSQSAPGMARSYDEAALAGEQPGVLLAQEALPEGSARRRDGLVGGGHAGTALPSCASTASTDRTMLWYPVQRHRLPSSPTRTSSSLGCGSRPAATPRP